MLWGVTLAPHTSLVGFQLLPVRKGQEMQLRARFFSDRVRIASTLASRSSRDVFSVRNCGWRWFRLFFEQVIHRISNIFKPFFFELYTRWRVIPFSGLPSGSARIPHEERSNKGMTSALLGHTFGAVSCVFFLFHKLLSAGCKTRLIRSQSCGADGAANSDETPDVRAMPLLLPSIWILQQKCGCARFAFKADCLVLQSVSTLPSIRSCKMEDFRKGGGKSYSPYVRPNS